MVDYCRTDSGNYAAESPHSKRHHYRGGAGVVRTEKSTNHSETEDTEEQQNNFFVPKYESFCFHPLRSVTFT